MQRLVSSLMIAALGLAALPASADNCDAFWTAFEGAPLDGKPDNDGRLPEPAFRYASGAAVYATAIEGMGDQQPGDLNDSMKMLYKLGVTMGDRIMTCYADPARDAGADELVETQEEAFPPTARLATIAAFGG